MSRIPLRVRAVFLTCIGISILYGVGTLDFCRLPLYTLGSKRGGERCRETSC
jgi:hypothetical protein